MEQILVIQIENHSHYLTVIPLVIGLLVSHPTMNVPREQPCPAFLSDACLFFFLTLDYHFFKSPSVKEQTAPPPACACRAYNEHTAMVNLDETYVVHDI